MRSTRQLVKVSQTCRVLDRCQAVREALDDQVSVGLAESTFVVHQCVKLRIVIVDLHSAMVATFTESVKTKITNVVV